MKLAVVSGASSGIGASVAQLLNDQGWRVHGLHSGRRNPNFNLSKWTAADFSDSDSVDHAISVINDWTDGSSIDLLVHCAGVFLPDLEMTFSTSSYLWKVNVVAPFKISEGLAHHCRRGSTVIFLGSVAGERAQSGAALYGASKAAVHQLVKSLGYRYSPAGIRVLGLSPGLVDTPMSANTMSSVDEMKQLARTLPPGRITSADEVAQLILDVASMESHLLTGQVLQATAGSLLSFGQEIWSQNGELNSGFLISTSSDKKNEQN